MIRITMLFLCVLLAAAAFGRYRAEVAVQDVKAQTEKLQRKETQLRTDIKLLRAEIAYLESPDRLKLIADVATDLEPVAGDQLVTANSFLSIIVPGAVKDLPVSEPLIDEIEHAMALADLGIIQ